MMYYHSDANKSVKETNLVKRIMKESMMASSTSSAILRNGHPQEVYTVPGVHENFFESSHKAYPPLLAAKNVLGPISPKSEASTDTTPQNIATNEQSPTSELNIDTSIPFDAFENDTNLPPPMILHTSETPGRPLTIKANTSGYDTQNQTIDHCHYASMYPNNMKQQLYTSNNEPSTFHALLKQIQSLFDCRKRRKTTAVVNEDAAMGSLSYEARAAISGPSLNEQTDEHKEQPPLSPLDIATIVQQYNRLANPYPCQVKQQYNIQLAQEQFQDTVFTTKIMSAEDYQQVEATYPETPSRQCSLGEAMEKLLGVTIANNIGWDGEIDDEGSPVVRKKMSEKSRVIHPFSKRGRIISKIRTFFGRSPWDAEPVPVKHVPFFFAMTPKSVEPETLIFNTKDGKKWVLSVYRSARIGSASAYVRVNPFVKI